MTRVYLNEIELTGSGGNSSVSWSDIENKPEFSDVATSGNYDDLENKPAIPGIPDNVSAFTNDAGYQTEEQVNIAINAKMGSVYHPKGDVATYADLPVDAQEGDVYNVLDTGDNYAFTADGTWDKLAGTVDLSNYSQKNHKHSAADITSGTISIDRLPNLPYIPIAGGTATGVIRVEKNDGDAGFEAKRTDSGVSALFGIGTGGVNHGVHSRTLAKWLLHADETDVYLNTKKITNVNAGQVFASPADAAGDMAPRALVSSDIPNLPASKITSGTIGIDRIPALGADKITSGTLSADRIPNLNASKITAGTLPIARGGTGLTASPSLLTNLASTSAANVMQASPRPGVTGILPLANGGTGVNGTSVTKNRVFASPNGSDGSAAFRALVAADIPNLDASKITSGTLPIARGGTGQAATSATMLDNSVISTPTSNYIGEIVNIWLSQWGKIAQISIKFKLQASNQVAPGERFDLGVLNQEYVPKITAGFSGRYVNGTINSVNGVIALTNVSNATLTSNNEYTVCSTYILK